MLNTVPSETKSAAELLLHPWLNDDIARGDDQYELYPDDDDHDFSNKFSATLIPQRQQKEANVDKIGTPLNSVVASSNSYCKDTSEISWDDHLSINEQMELDNVVLSYCDNEDENCDSDKESDDPVDSDSDETDDSNETIIEFGSGDSYVEGDASYAPTKESFSDANYAFLL